MRPLAQIRVNLLSVMLFGTIVQCSCHESVRTSDFLDSAKNIVHDTINLKNLSTDKYARAVFVMINEQGRWLDGEASESYGLDVTTYLWNSSLQCQTLRYLAEVDSTNTSSIAYAIAAEYVIQYEDKASTIFELDTRSICLTISPNHRRFGLRCIAREIQRMVKASE
jgi:hypothetical protein